MVETFLILIGLQLLGEWLSLWLALPIPGPVLGMLLLFIGLCVRRGVPPALQHGVPAFLQHLSLLFVPAGAGILLYAHLLNASAAAHLLNGQTLWQLVLALAVGTTVTLLASALLLAGLMRLRGEARHD